MDEATTSLETWDSDHPHAGMPTGVLGDIAKRRQEIIDEQVLTLTVPRWSNPELRVKFHPIPHEVFKKAYTGIEKSKKEDIRKRSTIEVNSNADIIIEGCTEIVAVLEDGSEVGLGVDGARGGFDADAAIALGMPPSVGARAVCRAIYITEGDMFAAVDTLAKWSGYRIEGAEDQLTGE